MNLRRSVSVIKATQIYTYLKTPIAGYGAYSKLFPSLNRINGHWMSKIDLEQVDLN